MFSCLIGTGSRAVELDTRARSRRQFPPFAHALNTDAFLCNPICVHVVPPTIMSTKYSEDANSYA
eukprot:6214563-Pleurochrysis_carterae.AAC.3